jgi:hypothetical protein
MNLKEAHTMADQIDETVNLDDLQADQEVYSSDSEKIGNVEGILEDVETGERFLQISRVLHSYFVPQHLIKYAVMGRPVILKIPHDEVVEQYRTRPKAV